MLSIIFNTPSESLTLPISAQVDMEKKTIFRGNREIFKASADLIINNIGMLTILNKNKEVSTIPYHITCDAENVSVWKQLNLPNNDYVVQVKGVSNINEFKISKIAIQKIIEDKNMLLNI